MSDRNRIESISNRAVSPDEINVLSFLKCDTITTESKRGKFTYPVDYPEIYIRNNFISGHLRTQGKGEGAYPIPYLQMINDIFGNEPETIEVCSRHVKVDGISTGFTVDVNPKFNPSFVTDGQTLAGIENNRFKRWRCDPPYNEATAYKMYVSSYLHFTDY